MNKPNQLKGFQDEFSKEYKYENQIKDNRNYRQE